MPPRNLVRLFRVREEFRQVRAADQPLGRGNRLLRVVGEDQVARLGQRGRGLFLGLRCLGRALVLDVPQIGRAFALRFRHVGGGGLRFTRGFGLAGIRAEHRIAVAAPASVAILRMMVSAFWSAVASLDCTARCMRTVASAELSRVRGYGFVSALDSLGSSVKLTLTSCVTSTKEKRISVAFPAGLAGTPIRNTSVCSSPAIRSRSGTV